MFAILSDVRNSYPLLPFKKGTVIEEGWPSDFDPTDKNLNEEEYHYFTTYYVHEIDELKEHIFNLLFELEINSIEFDRLNEYIDKTLFTCP